jgi:succinate dehydrogenase / fumarate reductase membrane anchor subunit
MSEKRVATSKVAGTWAWALQRLSAVALIVLLAIHIYLDHFEGVANEDPDLEPLITFGDVSVRLDQLAFIVVDYLLLGFVLFHGLNGARTVLLDFDRFGKHRKALDIGLFILGVATLIWGIIILFPFIQGA